MSTDALPRFGWTDPTGGPIVGELDIDDQVVDVYQDVARHGEISPATFDEVALALGMPVEAVLPAVMQLLELHLVRTDGVFGDRLVPVDRQSATTLLVSPIERAIYQQRELADRLRDRIDTIARPRADVVESIGGIDCLNGVAEIRGLLKLAGDVCRSELVVLRPGIDNEALDGLLDACYPVLSRGVKVRIIGPHGSRVGFAARAKARRLIDAGATIRTISQVSQASVVFDRSLAVMFGTPGNAGLATARRIRDDNVVSFLLAMFDQLWDGAAALGTDEEGYADEVTDDLQRSIARLMAQGFTDEVVARRLGMSVRTCRRHIAALLRQLGAVSRFQAGVQAAQHFTEESALRA
jgi:DNA-binding CsgD family transcriptional regulator